MPEQCFADEILGAADYSEGREAAIWVAGRALAKRDRSPGWRAEMLERLGFLGLLDETADGTVPAYAPPWNAAMVGRFIISRYRERPFTLRAIEDYLPARAGRFTEQALQQLLGAGLAEDAGRLVCPNCGHHLGPSSRPRTGTSRAPWPKSHERVKRTLEAAQEMLGSGRKISARAVARAVGHSDDKTARNDLDWLAAQGKIPPRPRKTTAAQLYSLTGDGIKLSRRIRPVLSEGEMSLDGYIANAAVT